MKYVLLLPRTKGEIMKKKKIIRKYSSVWKLSNTCLDNPFPKDEITMKIERILSGEKKKKNLQKVHT